MKEHTKYYQAVKDHWFGLSGTIHFILSELDFGKEVFKFDDAYYSKSDIDDYKKAFDELEELGWVSITKYSKWHYLIFKVNYWELSLTEAGLAHLKLVIKAIEEVTGKKVIPNTKSYTPLTEAEKNFMLDGYIQDFYESFHHYRHNSWMD